MPASEQQREHAVERAAKVFKALKDAARMREVCPKQKVLAQRFGCSVGAIQKSLNFLVANGMIELLSTRPNLVVRIVASGDETV